MESNQNRHYAVIDPYVRTLTIKYRGQVIAKTDKAYIVKEVAKSVYDPVFYIPKEDTIVPLEKETGRESSCPIKGEATYWNLKENPTSGYFAWSYENPLPRSRKIEGLVAFSGADITFISEPIIEN